MQAPLHSLHLALMRWCWQMLALLHYVHVLLMRWCGQMIDKTLRPESFYTALQVFFTTCLRTSTSDRF